jgi:hypothetical protein
MTSMCRAAFEECLDPRKLDPRSALTSIESAFRGAEMLAAANPRDFQLQVNELRITRIYAVEMKNHGLKPDSIVKGVTERARVKLLGPDSSHISFGSVHEQLRRASKLQQMILDLESMLPRAT